MDAATAQGLITAFFAQRIQAQNAGIPLPPAPVPPEVVAAVHFAIAGLDDGSLRVVLPSPPGSPEPYQTQAWLKEAILLYFSVVSNAPSRSGELVFHDKIPTKQHPDKQQIRIVPPGVVRYGAYVAPGCVIMPGYVNIGAYVDAGTMVDTFATVGSCAQIGSHVHLSGGVGIGGVLEPPQAQPVIIESGAFIGSRAIVVEGVRVGSRAVLGAGVVLTASTPIIDVRGSQEVVHKGFVPPNCVVIPGTRPKAFAAGTYQIPCALIIGERSAQTDLKTSLNAALRDFQVAV